MIARFKSAGIRTSIFCDPDPIMIEGAAKTGTDRIELYTEQYAKLYSTDKEKAIAPYRKAAHLAKELGLGINAGHDLDRHNLAFFVKEITFIDEVSIGHALISDALYYGWQNSIQMYRRQLENVNH
jgi:pyridoxine 5-phosphate synthase